MIGNIQTTEAYALNAARHSRWKALGGAGGAGSAFGAALKKQVEIHQQNVQVGVLPEKTKSQAQEAAAGLVANALILPVLKQVRRSKLTENSVFSGGNGEKTFGPQFDMALAEQMANSPRMTATAALKERMLKKAAIAANDPAKAPTGIDLHG